MDFVWSSRNNTIKLIIQFEPIGRHRTKQKPIQRFQYFKDTAKLKRFTSAKRNRPSSIFLAIAHKRDDFINRPIGLATGLTVVVAKPTAFIALVG